MSTLITLSVLSLAISHMGWVITQSGIMRPLRELITQPTLREGIGCIMCTVTQLSLLLAWLLPDVIEGPAPVVYVVKAMMLAKVSLLLYDLGEWVGTLSLSDSTHEEEPNAYSDIMPVISKTVEKSCNGYDYTMQLQ